MSGGKSGKQTVGYWYKMGLHFGICHGPVDALTEIRVGDRTAYDVEITGSTTIYINEPKLFGGKGREGGVQGYADVLGGTPTQGVNAYLQEQIGAEARVPAFRGLFALVFKGGKVAANNPYIKEWAFKVRRIIEGWGEYGTEQVDELAADVLYPWDAAVRNAENPLNTHEYRYDPPGAAPAGSWSNLGTVLGEAEVVEGYSLSSTPMGWYNSVDGVGPYDVTADTSEFEVLKVLYQGAVDMAYLDEGNVYGYGEYTPGGSYCGELISSGVSLNTMAWMTALMGIIPATSPGGLIYRNHNGSAEIDPRPTAGVNGWLGLNNCFGSPSTQARGQPATLIDVRRVPSPPEIPGTDLPDWPEDPANYTWDESTGQIYSKAPYVQTAGSYRWLSVYSTSGGQVTRYPLGPILEQGDASDTQAFWEAAYDAAVLAGDLPAGMTYQANGLGGITTYPRNSTYAWARSYPAIVPSQPPDPGIAQIGDDMNPAHIVRQCITNTEWGMGYPDASIDSVSFTAAAQALYDEGFGLSFQWVQQQPIEEFIGEVLNHCGGVWYADPRTGLFSMALIRDDYNVSDLRVFDESNILRVESYQKPGYGELVNQIVVAWTDVANKKDATTPPLQDPACIQAQGAVIGEVRQYPGITKADLAQRVALRDLTAASTPLATLKLKVNREGWDLIPGKDVIVVNWDKLGIVQLICRVLKVDRGTLDDGTITLEVAEDVFGLPSAVYTTQEEEGWTEPDTGASDITMQDLVESPYWDVARNLSAADLDYADVDAGYVFTLAARNTEVETEYRIWSRDGGTDSDDEYEERNVGPFAPTALLNGAIGQQDTTINLDNGVDLSFVTVGGRVLIGSGAEAEFCEVLTLDTTTGVMTVSRAVLDTTPQEHADNTRVWFVDDSFGVDTTERALSDEVDVKLTAVAPAGESELEDATEQTIVMAGRFGRPYPPGRIRINGQSFPTLIDTTEEASEGFVIDWAHRDRTQQDVNLVSQNEDDIGPEPGTTYTVELYNDLTDVLVDSASGISGTSTSLIAANSFNARLEIFSVRDGRESWQRQVRHFYVIGDEVLEDEDGDFLLGEDGEILSAE